MNLRQVKNRIYQTECRRLMLDGMCCSEPVMTKDENGIIDNYFIYGEAEEEQAYSSPVAYFGVYSEEPRTAYIRRAEETDPPKEMIRAENWRQYDETAYKLYCDSFSKLREFVFKAGCSEEEKKVLRTYVQCLKKITDGGLWPIYRSIGEDFFRWAQETEGE